jgi:alkylhydroperoxidase family enzyme
MEASGQRIQPGIETPRRPGLLRAGLLALAIPQIAIGLWALISPSGWYETFPGAGRHWLPAYGSFDEHLATDIGAGFLALGVLLALAGVWLDRRAVQAALIAYLAFEVPHFVFHLGADDVLPTGDRIVSWVVLASSIAVAGGLFALTRVPPASARSRQPSNPTGGGSARISPRRKGLFARLANWYSRRAYGHALTPVGVFGHHPKLALGYGGFEFAVEHSHRAPARLKALAETKVAALVSCEWCMDFASHVGRATGITETQLTELPRHRESESFSELEKVVLDYAVAMTRTPADVSGELFARLREHFDEAQLVELTNAIAIENFRARFNHATGIASQRFSEGAVCVVPERLPEDARRTPARA